MILFDFDIVTLLCTDEAMEDEAQKRKLKLFYAYFSFHSEVPPPVAEAAIAYATFVKSDDGIPGHGNLTSRYDEYADKIAAAQNSTLEYQDEMKVKTDLARSIQPIAILNNIVC